MLSSTQAEQALTIIRSTRLLTFPHYGNIEVLAEKRTAQDLVTECDLTVEQQLQRNLRAIDPAIGFCGEETGGERNQDRFWLVDPIDGTAHFLRGLPFCTTMVALIEYGDVTFSAIYDFVHDMLYSAQKGRGATVNGAPLQVSNRPLHKAYLGWESNLDIEENRERYHILRKRCMLFKTISSGYEHAMIAAGKLDGRICFDPWGKDYDFAPASLLVHEAGGVVHNLGTSDYHFANVDFIAANPLVYAALVEADDAVFPLENA